MKYRQYFFRYVGLALLAVLYICLNLAYSYVIPFSKGPDEYINYQYILFIAKNHRLPVTLAEKQEAGVKADWQPLYHLVSGLAASTISLTPPPELKVTWEPPTRHLIDLVLPRATLVRTEDERPPFRGVYAVWQTGRWVSLILGLGTLIITYLIGLTLWPRQPALATGITGLLIFMPRFLFTHAVLSDDTMLGFWLALYLLGLTRLITSPTRHFWWLFVGLGITTGLAIVTKYTAIPAAAGALITIGWVAHSQKWPQKDLFYRVAAFSGGLTVSAGWWVAWIWWHFNQINTLGLVLGLMKPLLPGAAVDDNPTTTRLTALLSGQSVASLGEAPGAGGNGWDWLQHTFTTFWGVTVYGAEPGWPYPYNVILVGLALLSVAAVIGGWRFYRHRAAKDRAIWLAFLLHLLLFFPLPLLRFALSGRLNDAAQGRHLLFPAGPVIVALLLAGWLAWIRPRWRGRVSLISAAGMLFWAMGHLIYLWSAYPAPLPVRTTPGPQIEVEHPLQVNFGDTLQLTGYQARLNGSILQIDLAWQSLTQAWEDYRTEITLVDRYGQPQLRWVSHPADGRFPVRAWQPGDRVRDTLHIPVAGLFSGEYEVQLRLLGWDKPLASDQGETLTLTTLALEKNLSPPTSIILWSQGKIATETTPSFADSLMRPFTGSPIYRYRSTIPVILVEPAKAVLIGPNGQSYTPAAAIGYLAAFLVDYNWPSGKYQLSVSGIVSDLKLQVQNFDTQSDGWKFVLPAMMQPVQANFDNQIELLGYDLPTRRVKAGGGIPLVLYWRGLAQMRADYTMSVQLLDANLQRRGGYDRFTRENYNTYLWAPTEVVDDGFAVPVEADAPDGVYTIRIGWYRRQAGQVASLPLIQNGQSLAETSLVIGPIKIGGPPAGVVAQTIAPEHPLPVVLGDVIALKGYDLSQEQTELRLKLYWQSIAQAGIDYTVFVHLRDKTGQTVAQLDKPPADGQYPTSLWDQGDIIPDTFILNLPARGQYQVVVGLYDPITGKRLTVPGGADNSVVLTEINLD